ncbi:TTF-type domain-containing protein [Citrus sinensis]|uniref:TTF-type domain-containing protein n=1 Tax=Citrus sinensis TaxID=2711 RepID=A0ACB8IJV4_CITSI|nr:TTF-type domain-containing protein [Citrus sinensis]
MRKPSKINQYFKRKNAEANTKSPNIKNSQVSLTNSPNFRNPPLKSQRIETNPVNTQLLERDPGLRPQIWVYDINQRDEICRAYIMAGPYQPRLSEYPKSGPEKHLRCFQSSWFDSFPSWLEYSPIKDAAFCLPCYLFNTPSAHPKCNAYTVNGFNVWRKVKDGINCAFLNHVGKDPNSTHKKAEKSCEDLMRQSQHLPQVFNCYSSQEIENNRLRLKTTVEAIRYLAFQVTLKDGIYSLLSHNNLNIQNIQGQGYDGASNMRVAVSYEIVPIHHFFTKLTSVVNIVGASCKRNEELKRAQAADIEYMISIDELESGATCSVLLNIIEDGTNAFQRGDADAAYEAMTSFEFVFILHLMKEIMAITDILCQALQSKSQDILHAMHLVSSTKALMQKFRDNGWITLLNQVKSFCEARNIDISEMNAHYVAR